MYPYTLLNPDAIPGEIVSSPRLIFRSVQATYNHALLRAALDKLNRFGSEDGL